MNAFRHGKARKVTVVVTESEREITVTVRDDATLAEMADLLAGRQVNRLPVTDGDGRLLGILARSDIVNAMMRIRSCS